MRSLGSAPGRGRRAGPRRGRPGGGLRRAGGSSCISSRRCRGRWASVTRGTPALQGGDHDQQAAYRGHGPSIGRRPRRGGTRLAAQSFGAFRFARTGGPVQTEADPLDPDAPGPGSPALEAILPRQRDGATIEWGEGLALRYRGPLRCGQAPPLRRARPAGATATAVFLMSVAGFSAGSASWGRGCRRPDGRRVVFAADAVRRCGCRAIRSPLRLVKVGWRARRVRSGGPVSRRCGRSASCGRCPGHPRRSWRGRCRCCRRACCAELDGELREAGGSVRRSGCAATTWSRRSGGSSSSPGSTTPTARAGSARAGGCRSPASWSGCTRPTTPDSR